MLSHYAWPGGLAFIIETPRRRFAAVQGPSGWRLGDAREVWRAGPPASATMATLELPVWLEWQLPSLDFTQLGLHTDFVRLNRVLARMQAAHANGVLIVLGPHPAALVLNGGAPTVIYPTGRDGEHADMVAARAVGWVCVLSGPIAIGATEDETQPLAEPAPSIESVPEAATPSLIAAASEPAELSARAEPEETAPEPPVVEVAAAAPETTFEAEPKPGILPLASPEPAPVPTPVERPSTPVQDSQASAPVAAPGAHVPVPSVSAAGMPTGIHVGDRFVAAAGARTLPEETAGQVHSIVGPKALSLVDLLDGSRTIQEIADILEVGADQVGQVVRILVGARLAFRYVTRSRPATGARSPG